MKRNRIRNLIGGLSFTSALFIFQACYGTPQDMFPDIYVQGHVKSASTGNPIEGIKVSVTNNSRFEYTDDEGNFSFYTELVDNLMIRFEDIDAVENGSFVSKDTTLKDVQDHLYFEIELNEIEK